MKPRYVLPFLAAAGIVMCQPQSDPAATALWGPVPPIVDSGAPPPDAIVLFDGTDLSEWTGDWNVEDGAVTVVAGAGSLTTKRADLVTYSCISSGARRVLSKARGRAAAIAESFSWNATKCRCSTPTRTRPT